MWRTSGSSSGDPTGPVFRSPRYFEQKAGRSSRGKAFIMGKLESAATLADKGKGEEEGREEWLVGNLVFEFFHFFHF